jgi:hypothetical protein
MHFALGARILRLGTDLVDQLQLLLVHPAGQCDQQKPERVQGFRHEESQIITASPAVHGHVGDPADLCSWIFRTLRHGTRVFSAIEFSDSTGLRPAAVTWHILDVYAIR